MGVAVANILVLAVAASTPPASLRATGLYATGSVTVIAETNRPFAPQYPLWSDGAVKRRWIYLPAPVTADFELPVGTKLWKEFTFGGHRVETRYLERTAAGWTFATYAWSADESDARLVPATGEHTHAAIAPGKSHMIPPAADCRACHGNAANPVLGFTALQLSADRDPDALHAEPRPTGALDLPSLVASGFAPAQDVAPRIAARSADERAALGYLHGNCGGCHRADGPLASLDMDLAAHALATTIDHPSRFTTADASVRIAPGAPERSVIVARISSRSPVSQMPPLGTQVVDQQAVALLSRWIAQRPTLSTNQNLAGDHR